MIDWGVITTGLGTIIGGIITGLATWKTMSAKEKNELDTEQSNFMNRLVADTKDLRERINNMQKTIDTLMEERQILKTQITDLTINILQQDATINRLQRQNTLSDQHITELQNKGNKTNDAP